jgi:molybdate transport system permease protein
MVVLLLIGVPIAYRLSRSSECYPKYIVETLIALPLVLPPTVLGFYLLIIFGKISNYTGLSIVFSFCGLLLGSVVYSLPFMVQPVQSIFITINNSYKHTSYVLRSTWFDYFLNIHLPIGKKGILVASALCFAHTVGEFGIVLMVGGNIPNETQVVSITIYEFVEKLDYGSAHLLSSFLLLLSFFTLLFLFKNNIRRVDTT